VQSWLAAACRIVPPVARRFCRRAFRLRRGKTRGVARAPGGIRRIPLDFPVPNRTVSPASSFSWRETASSSPGPSISQASAQTGPQSPSLDRTFSVRMEAETCFGGFPPKTPTSWRIHSRFAWKPKLVSVASHQRRQRVGASILRRRVRNARPGQALSSPGTVEMLSITPFLWWLNLAKVTYSPGDGRVLGWKDPLCP
jgi:hypothetical protein